MYLIDDGAFDAGDEPVRGDEQIQWHAGPVTPENVEWTWSLIEDPPLCCDWPGYDAFIPGPVHLN